LQWDHSDPEGPHLIADPAHLRALVTGCTAWLDAYARRPDVTARAAQIDAEYRALFGMDDATAAP
jgi:hypothetical protein